MTLQQLIKVARIKSGLSLRKASAKCGLSNTYISQLETGKITNPTVPVLRKLSIAFPFYAQEILLTQGIKGMFIVPELTVEDRIEVKAVTLPIGTIDNLKNN